jgi:hypothetical protein
VFEARRSSAKRFCGRRCATAAHATHGGHVLPVGTVRPSGKGYMQVKTENGWRAEHRIVMEHELGRPLRGGEQVHHKNGRRDDNRLENLELRSGAHGIGATKAHCRTCTCFD